MKNLLTTVFLISLLISGCCVCEAGKDNQDIPEEVLVKSDNFIISKTGKDFFGSYISSDNQRTVKTPDGYLVVYNFSVPDKPGIEGEIRFNVDENGNIIHEKEIVGIPGCLSNPENCIFSISKERAVNIAAENGLREGVRDWEVNFKWNSVHNKYAWEVLSIFSESKGEGYYRATGETMLVDPGSGEIIETSEWMIN